MILEAVSAAASIAGAVGGGSSSSPGAKYSRRAAEIYRDRYLPMVTTDFGTAGFDNEIKNYTRIAQNRTTEDYEYAKRKLTALPDKAKEVGRKTKGDISHIIGLGQEAVERDFRLALTAEGTRAAGAKASISEGFADATRSLSDSYDRAVRAAKGEAGGKIEGGLAGAEAALVSAQRTLEPLVQEGRLARDNLAKLLGMGEGGAEAIAELWEATPGYKFTMDQSERAIGRSASVKGLLQSGAFASALQENAAGISNQFYQQHLDNLSNFSIPGTEALIKSADFDAMKGEYRTRAGEAHASLAESFGSKEASLYADRGMAGAELAAKKAMGLAEVDQTSAQLRANLWSGKGMALAELESQRAGAFENIDRQLTDILQQSETAVAGLDIEQGKRVMDLSAQSIDAQYRNREDYFDKLDTGLQGWAGAWSGLAPAAAGQKSDGGLLGRLSSSTGNVNDIINNATSILSSL